jgi:hypothetical protein
VSVSRSGVFSRFWTTVVCAAAVVAIGVSSVMTAGCRETFNASKADSPNATPEVFTTAHETFGQAVREFLSVKSTPVQPIEFPHNIHIGKDIKCTEYCHESVTKGPRAGLPSLNTCMICHSAIATDKPRIQTITAMSDKGQDIQWQRVNGYPQQAHVHFNHAPHIRAGVDCSTCHGDIGKGTVATRNVDLNMGFCVTCHRQKNAPNECITCHF